MDEQKAWQHGYELDYLKEIESHYARYNSYTSSPFAAYNKNNIAEDLHNKTLQIIHDNTHGGTSSRVLQRVKVASAITLYQDVIIAQKHPNDVVITKLECDATQLTSILDPLRNDNVWIYVWGEDERWPDLLSQNDFYYVGGKVTTFGEIYGIWFRDSATFTLFDNDVRSHPKLDLVEFINIKKVCDIDPRVIMEIETNLNSQCLKFTNHYSNYNKDKSWSAISLRGYTNDWQFITKPAEMSKRWQEEHANIEFKMQNTDLYQYFPEVKSMLYKLFDGPLHRIRFMKLQPGGGELERHTDLVDKDAGNNIGKLARFHFPIVTNDQMEFNSWSILGEKHICHMKVGEMWLLDTRKPHRAINNGSEARTHLVVDVQVTPKIKEMILDNAEPRRINAGPIFS